MCALSLWSRNVHFQLLMFLKGNLKTNDELIDFIGLYYSLLKWWKDTSAKIYDSTLQTRIDLECLEHCMPLINMFYLLGELILLLTFSWNKIKLAKIYFILLMF